MVANFIIRTFLALVALASIYFSFANKQQIDVVIPCCKKDQKVLEACIDGIRRYGHHVRRVIVVSSEPLTAKAEWFDEKRYPFQLLDLGQTLFPNDPKQAEWFATQAPKRGWIYQQLLKLYAPLVIPNLSSQVLILDSDVRFLKPVSFITPTGVGLYNLKCGRPYPAYLDHIHRLLPKLPITFSRRSAVCHHMLFQKQVIDALFQAIEEEHHCPPWQALCKCIDLAELNRSCLSEYELYLNYLFSCPSRGLVRLLKWHDFSSSVPHLKSCYTYIACHNYIEDVK